MNTSRSQFLNGRILSCSRNLKMIDVFVDACDEKYRQEKNVTDVERKHQWKYMIAAGKPDSIDDLQIERYSIESNSWETLHSVPGWTDCCIHYIDNCLYLIDVDVCPTGSENGNKVCFLCSV